MNNLKDYIITVDDVVADKLCDSIIKEFTSEEYLSSVVGNGVVNLSTRNVNQVCISLPLVIEKNPVIRRQIDKYLYLSAIEAIKQYKDKFPLCLIEEDSGYELLKYEVGQFYTQHTDSFKARPRTVSCSFILNDDYKGGEFAFFDRELKYKLKKGSCIMFPSNFMYPHEIMPVTSGTRYSIITWFI
jgi:Rps23 Pro-64 3,4-dihydroxylase Tpa1-like proline 4-hydroxylase